MKEVGSVNSAVHSREPEGVADGSKLYDHISH